MVLDHNIVKSECLSGIGFLPSQEDCVLSFVSTVIGGFHPALLSDVLNLGI